MQAPWQLKWLSWQFTRKRQQAFLEDLCSLVDDGVSVSAAIDTIANVSEGVSQKVAKIITKKLSEGKLLADGMQDWFHASIVEVVRAGESGGNLPESLRAALNSFSEHTTALSVMINSLVYPVCVIFLALVVVVFVKNSVLVQFAQIRPVSLWPDMGRQLFWLGVIVERWWWLLILFFIAAIFVMRKVLHDLTGSPRRFLDHLPFLSLYREIIAARFMETLGLLISNGVVLKRALSLLHNESSPYLSWHLVEMENRLSSGKDNIADVLNTDLINRNDLIRLRVVTQGKNFEHALISLGKQANKRNLQTLNLIGRVLAGLLLIVAAFIAATIVLGIYSIGSILAA